MNIRPPLIASALLAVSLISGTAQAALHDRGGGLIYDDVLNVTWLQDANYVKTSGYDADGKMTWVAATTWAANLVYHDSVRNMDYSDWRLPTMVDTGTSGCNYANGGTDCGYNVQTVSGSIVYSEMAHMYYNNLGLKAYGSPTGAYQPDFGIFGNGTTGGQNDVGLIDNLQSYMYWSGLGYASIPTMKWSFHADDGYQDPFPRAGELYAWAVRPGDVAVVPEPETYAMMLTGLGLVGFMARRRKLIKV
jgi:hypothetical protein